MGFSDNLTEIATDLAQSVAATSKRLAEIAKLTASNLAEEGGIKKAYVELGKLYYAEHGATPEAGYAAACEKISAAKAVPTNADRVLGQTGRVTEAVDNDSARGAVYVDGKTWSARSAEGDVIPAGSRVEIVKMEGVKLFVRNCPKTCVENEEAE